MVTRYSDFTANSTRYRLDRHDRDLFKHATTRHPLTTQQRKLLELFLSRPQEAVITKEDIFSHLFHGTNAGDGNVFEAIKSLRKCLGDGFIINIYAEGWRLADTIRHFDNPPEPTWQVNDARDYTRLATASLHRPSPHGNEPGAFDRLGASFRCEIVEYPFGNRTIAVGLRQVTLAFDLKSCIFAENTLLGDTKRPLDHVVAGANSITVKAPMGEMLTGSPLLGEYIAELEPVGTGLPSVGLAVAAPDRGFAFAYLDDEGRPEPPRRMDDNKEIILNLIYRDTPTPPKDSSGRLLLATSKAEKKPE